MVDKKKYVMYAVICFTTIILILLANNDSVWCDEAYTMLNCRGSFSYMYDNLKVDSWPPFYLFFSWIYAKLFVCSVFSLKIFSIIPVFILMLYGSRVIYRETGSLETTLLFDLLTSFMPISIHTALEIRGYSWAMLFVTICGIEAWLFFKNTESKKHAICFFVSGILAAYTHYFALVSVCYIYMFLMLGLLFDKSKRKILKKWLLFVICSLIVYTPWITKFIGATKSVTKGGYWIQSISLNDLLDFFQFPFVSEIDNLGSVNKNIFSELALIIICWLVINTIIDIKKEKDIKKKGELYFQICCVMVIVFTIISGYILSKILQPIFVPRYMKPALGLLWLFVAIRFSNMNKNCKSFLLAFGIVLCSYGFLDQKNSELNTGTESAKQVIQNQVDNGFNSICSDSDYLNWTEIEYYFPEVRSYKDCSDINIITDNGKQQKMLFLATKDFSEYGKKFEDINYSIEDLGEYNFDNCYIFELYLIEKNNKNEID